MPAIISDRLAELKRLRRRIDHEIAVEERRIATTSRATPTRPATTRRTVNVDDLTTRQILARTGATPLEVKTWALTQGIQCARSGPVPHDVALAYLLNHEDPTEGNTAA